MVAVTRQRLTGKMTTPAVPAPAVRLALRAARPLLASQHLPLWAQRRLVDAFTSVARAPRGTTFRRGRIAGVDVEWVDPPGTDGHGRLLYLHGGGYVLGSARGFRGVAAQLAAATGLTAVVADYRLAPEHPHPAALDDALAVYTMLLQADGARSPIVIAGDSAGGGLALAVLLALRERGIPQPACAGLICPWLDLAADLDRVRAAAPDPLLQPAMTTRWAQRYTGESNPLSPGISPLFGDLDDLAPIVVHSASDDPLATDTRRLVERIRQATGVVEHRCFPGRWHDFHLQIGLLADAREALTDMGARLRNHLETPPGRGWRASAPVLR